MRLSAESEALCRRMMARCRDLFRGTAQVIRRNLEARPRTRCSCRTSSRTAGCSTGSTAPAPAERIFLELCRGKDLAGATGIERARSYVRKFCGNRDALSPAGAP